jgi:hypothetical protein
MVKPSDRLEKVCTHPPVPPPERTAAKCALCMKPLARENMVTKDGKAFCCNAAADQFFASDAHYQEYMARSKGGGFGRLVKKVIVILVLLGLAAAAYFYWSENRDSLKQKADELKQQATDAVDRAK